MGVVTASMSLCKQVELIRQDAAVASSERNNANGACTALPALNMENLSFL